MSLLKNWERKVMAAAKVNTMLGFASHLRGSNEIFRQIMSNNAFWEQTFDMEEILLGHRIHSNFLYTPRRLELEAEDVHENLQKDLDRFLQIVTNQTNPDDGLNVSLSEHTSEDKTLLGICQAWGQRDVGLRRLYEVSGTIHLLFDKCDGLPGKEELIDSRKDNFIADIVDVIEERQEKITIARKRKELTPNFLKSINEAIESGLPSNFESRFSSLKECYMDCYVIDRYGELRPADMIFDENGNELYLAEAGIGQITAYGVKTWKQIFYGETVIKITYIRRIVDGEVHHQYEYRAVVSPQEQTTAQSNTIQNLAVEVMRAITGTTADIDTNSLGIFTWLPTASRIFQTDSSMSNILDYKEIVPEYFEEDGVFQHFDQEVILRESIIEGGETINRLKFEDEAADNTGRPEQNSDDISSEAQIEFNEGATIEEGEAETNSGATTVKAMINDIAKGDDEEEPNPLEESLKEFVGVKNELEDAETAEVKAAEKAENSENANVTGNTENV